SVTGVAIGDVDGDRLNELLIGRDVGGGGRLLVFGGAIEGFEQSDSIADGWGPDRGVRGVAIAPRPVCQARRVDTVRYVDDPGIPESAQESREGFDARLAEVIEANVAAFLPRLLCADSSDPDRGVEVLGPWEGDDIDGNDRTETIQFMMAGFAA